LSGSEFQTVGPATEKAVRDRAHNKAEAIGRVPTTVDKLKDAQYRQ